MSTWGLHWEEGDSLPESRVTSNQCKSEETWSAHCREARVLGLTKPGALTGAKGLGSLMAPAHSWHSESTCSLFYFCSFKAIQHAEIYASLEKLPSYA